MRKPDRCGVPSCARRAHHLGEHTAEECTHCGAGAGDCDCEARIACADVGKIGHQMCGMCTRCDAPRFICGHLADLMAANTADLNT